MYAVNCIAYIASYSAWPSLCLQALCYNIAMKVSMYNVFHTHILLISYTHRIQNNLNSQLECIMLLTVHIITYPECSIREYPSDISLHYHINDLNTEKIPAQQ